MVGNMRYRACTNVGAPWRRRYRSVTSDVFGAVLRSKDDAAFERQSPPPCSSAKAGAQSGSPPSRGDKLTSALGNTE